MDLAACPEHVAVIGGGRWARVLTEALVTVVAGDVRVSVHSPHNAAGMSTWAAEMFPSGRVEVFDERPTQSAGRSRAVIIANAAHDHDAAVEWALDERIPALVEKPFASSAAAAQRFVAIALERDVRLAPAHIFRFATYLDEFSSRIAAAGAIRALRVVWTDPVRERRYGDEKRYDEGLPVFADWLPHVLSIVRTLTPEVVEHCESLEVRHGGSHVECDLRLGGVICQTQLVRNSDRRRRVVEVDAGDQSFRLDFSDEPGTTSFGAVELQPDPQWNSAPKPSARMLAAFLQWAAGGPADARLDTGLAIQSCRVIDQISEGYRAALTPWLADALVSAEPDDSEAVGYALSELKAIASHVTRKAEV